MGGGLFVGLVLLIVSLATIGGILLWNWLDERRKK